MKEQVKQDFIKAITENPDLPIKVFISGECYEDDASWFVGEVFDCRVTEIVTYGNGARFMKKPTSILLKMKSATLFAITTNIFPC